jgi:hypothetical protein
MDFRHGFLPGEWESGCGSDDEPLFDEILHVLGPHAAALRAQVDKGAEAALSVSGEVYGSVITTPVEAERRNYYVPEGQPFEAFFACDRVGLFLKPEVVEFLAAVRASFGTHIDVELDPAPGEVSSL